MGGSYNENLIFDVGMHIGQDTEFYLKKGFDVVAIEANPVLVKQAQEKFATYINRGQLKILEIGIADVDGELPFYVNETYSEWSSLTKWFENHEYAKKFHEIKVKCTTIDKVIEEFGVPYYLKVDIEASDTHVINRLHLLKAKPKYVSVENGYRTMLDGLQTAGYDKFKFINQAKVTEMKCPFPPLEGTFVDQQFISGASGPFGEETVGEWKDYDAIALEINAYWNKPDLNPVNDGWFDLHAKLSEH